MWFLDTGFLIALVSPKDTYHAQALALQSEIQRERR
jgi:predicted nucleic acid-binding protein